MNHASAEMKLTPVSFLRNLPATGGSVKHAIVRIQAPVTAGRGVSA